MHQPVVFFDGRCNLCNRAVDFLIRHDHKQILKFAPLDGATARENLPVELTGDRPDSVVLLYRSKISTQSTAALRTLLLLGGGFRIFALGFVVPQFLRDFIYAIIARQRYFWFGRRETCRIPSPQERAQFLP